MYRSKTLSKLQEKLSEANERLNDVFISDIGWNKTVAMEEHINYMQRLLNEIMQAYKKERKKLEEKNEQIGYCK